MFLAATTVPRLAVWPMQPDKPRRGPPPL